MWIVICYDNYIGKLCSNFVYQWLFVFVMIFVIVEDNDYMVCGEGMNGGQYVFKCIWFVCVVDIGKCFIDCVVYQFKLFGSVDQFVECCYDCSWVDVCGYGKVCGNQCIGYLEIVGEWNIYFIDVSIVVNFCYLFVMEMFDLF